MVFEEEEKEKKKRKKKNYESYPCFKVIEFEEKRIATTPITDIPNI